MDLPDHLGELFVAQDTRRLRTPEPVVISRCRHMKEPAGHRDRNVVVGELADQRVEHLGRALPQGEMDRALENVILRLQLPGAAAKVGELLPGLGGQLVIGAGSGIGVVLFQPRVQARAADAQILGELDERCVASPRELDRAAAEVGRVRRGHGRRPFLVSEPAAQPVQPNASMPVLSCSVRLGDRVG